MRSRLPHPFPSTFVIQTIDDSRSPGMFGDPQGGPPKIHLQFSLSHLDRETTVAPHLGPQAVLSIEPPTSPEALPRAFGLAQSMVGFGDAVEGWIWGNVAGIAVRAGREGLTVRSVTLNKHVEVGFVRPGGSAATKG